jgi:hypothetical protein
MEWMRDNRQKQIKNQPLMGVTKVRGDTAVKSKAAPAVNGVFCRWVDHGGGKKVGTNGRAAVDNRQQWQQQTDNNQLRVMVASGVVDSHGGGGNRRWLTGSAARHQRPS